LVKQVLDNGLTILIEERPESPVVAIVTYVKTGYFDEQDQYAGISHVFEHMFFKGTRRRPNPEDISQATKALGGILNAGTGYETTSYYAAVPTENFEKAIDIQFDALTDPLLDPNELQKEIEVVIQESRQKLDNPSAYSLEKMWEQAFDRHRIRRWRIGYPDALRAITREDLLRYYNERYTPSNIILTIVGGVESGRALQVAEQLYSEIPARELIQNPSLEESDQNGLRFARLKGDINQKLLYMGFRAPSVLDTDHHALSVAIDMLGDGRSSRLYQSIMENRQMVSNIGAFYSAYKDIGVVTVSAEVLGDDPSQVSIAIFEEMEKLKKEPIRRDELEKVKNVVESEVFFEQEQVLGRAGRLSYFEALGDWRLSDDYIDRLRQVDAADVARVAAKYLTVERTTVLEYVPETAKLPDYNASKLGKKASHAVIHVPSALPVTSVSMDTNLRRAILPSGATLITEIDPSAAVVGAAIYFKGGRRCETRGIAGITELALRSSIKGTSKYSAEDIARRIENLGTFIGTNNSSDYFGYSLRILSKNFEEGFDLLSDVIADASFPEDEVAKEREALRYDIRRIQDSSFSYASDLLGEIVFPDHPYGLPDYGYDETVASFSRDKVADWHKAMCSPEAAIIAIVGDIHVDTATKAAEGLFQRLGKKPTTCSINPTVFPTEIKEKSAKRDRAQTAAAMAFPGVATDDPGRYALDVVSALTSGLGGRFFAEVRGRLGLAYVVQAANHAGAAGGIFVVYTATSPENEIKAREAVFNELERLREELAEPEEVERAKNYLKGARLISLQASVSRARERASNEIYGRGLNGTAEYLEGIARITPEDVLNACRRHFSPSRYCLGVVRGKK
jgi:zinc protease